ncbi:MAG: symmetrical bis(5'-nucleosyl)-tetraphosphatase [Sinobacteraceae bacterium]|nr:symmetrical bis(5'-nucleosyl)-tetraphosphatase [Nevskiaceae bacterium]
MTRYAVGDVQGCHTELRALLDALKFSADRDQLWFVGDLVNRGPDSLAALRLVRSLADNAIVVLGNHDLHLLAVANGARRLRRSDTLDDILSAPDRDQLLDWLQTRPLAYQAPTARAGAMPDLLVHAGVVPQWSAERTLELAAEVERALQTDPRSLFQHMYGDEPERWSDELTGMPRLRFTINVLTRIRVCTPDGRVDLQSKGKPPPVSSGLLPWFDCVPRATQDRRVIFGHWSALGFFAREDVVGLDSGCVWGGSLTAYDLDRERPPISLPCRGYQLPGE